MPNLSLSVSAKLESFKLIKANLCDGIKLRIITEPKFLPSLWPFNSKAKMNTIKLNHPCLNVKYCIPFEGITFEPLEEARQPLHPK